MKTMALWCPEDISSQHLIPDSKFSTWFSLMHSVFGRVGYHTDVPF